MRTLLDTDLILQMHQEKTGAESWLTRPAISSRLAPALCTIFKRSCFGDNRSGQQEAQLAEEVKLWGSYPYVIVITCALTRAVKIASRFSASRVSP